MAPSRLPFVFIFFSISVNLFAVIPTTAQLSPEDSLSFCIDNYGNYTTGSAYKTNLDHVLSNFSSLSVAQFNGGFYNISAGVIPDRVNAIGLCRGDLQASDCYDCLHNLRTSLIKQCPNQKEAIGWYYNCMFRYSSRSIFGAVDNSSKIISTNGVNATSPSNTNEFELVLRSLVNRLIGIAASGGSLRKFATGNVSVPESQTMYALVQCTPDLSQLDCENCLFGALDDAQLTFPGKGEVAAFLPSCHIRYDNETFYGPGLRSPPPSSPVLPVSPPAQSSGTGTKGFGGRAYQIFVVPAAVAVLTQLFIFIVLF